MNRLINSLDERKISYRLNEPMRLYTTFKTGGPAELFIVPRDEDELKQILCFCSDTDTDYFVLGKGSNLLVSDDGIRNKAVIYIGDDFGYIKEIDDCTFEAGAGASVASICKYALSKSRSGLEFAYGIPGSVGGAAFMNAGAYGGEMKDVLTEITHLSPDMQIETISAADAELSYRHSVYKKNGCIVLSAKAKLSKDSKDNIKERMNDFLGRRKDKQPLEYPSAGSTFKRPEGYFAGALIQECNLKGKSVGGAQVSEKHAGFVINKDNATSTDILNLIDLIKNTVKTETGVTLEPEVIVLR